MKRTTRQGALPIAFAALVLALAAAPWAEPPAGSAWKLTFSDEFDGPTLDASRWSNGYALEKTGPGSWPDPANVRLEGGSLKLYGEQRAGQGKSYAGAAITTRGKFSQMYGYLEARIKVPNGKGFSAKLTGTKADGGYPPWLDIIETRGEEPDHPYWYLHAGGKEAGGGWNGANLATEFHTLGTEWNADELIFTVDGEVKLRDRSLAPQCRMAMCWALELMVGGDSWIGIPDGGTPWPGVCEIDYVRIYSRQGPATGILRAGSGGTDARSGVAGTRAARYRNPDAGGAYRSAAMLLFSSGSGGFLADGRWWTGAPERAGAGFDSKAEALGFGGKEAGPGVR